MGSNGKRGRRMSLNQFEWREDYEGLFDKEIPSQLLQNHLIKKDIWRTKEDLGLEFQEHNKIVTINFRKINPQWLKLLSKLYILKRASQKISIDYLRINLVYLRKFAKFFQEKGFSKSSQIDNKLFEEFESWINLTKLKETSISNCYTVLTSFFDICRLEGWLDIDTYWFRGRKKAIKLKNNKINYLPEEVWNQLEDNLGYLPKPMQRKILIIRTLGLRIGELLNLPLDCLRKRENRWRLRLKETEKFKIEDELPIPEDLVLIIKEQQEYIQKNLGANYQKLFCGSNYSKGFKFTPVARVMSVYSFNNWLNRLAKQYNICSKNGQIWHFTSHQFRRTVGTILTNAGVRDLIIQKYLRHRNPDMQKHYKYLLKEVIGDEYQELTKEKNLVNIEGKVIATHKPSDAIEEYIRLKLHQITTQQGECHRSNLKKPCPTVNGCWRCQDWITSEKDLLYLKQDLGKLKNEIKKAKELGLVRVAKEIQRDINYLQIRICTLEAIVNDD